MTSWKTQIEEEWTRRHREAPGDPLFPLMKQAFDGREIIAAVESLLSGQLTMRDGVAAFERRFAETIGAKYAVMVNSGSSANLLAVAAASNPAAHRRLEPGDEVLIPAVCWSTSFWPLVQHGLRPVLVDVDPDTLNLSIEDARRRITPRTRAILLVHVLGNSSPMHDVMRVARDHDLLLIEDTCESLASTAAGKNLGTFGRFGTFSFYYSHHVTTGEGGMVACATEEDYDLLKCLRAHGWSREASNRAEIESQHPDIDPRFLFINCGYNLRPLELQAALGNCQLDRLPEISRARNTNRERLIGRLTSHPRWHDQLSFTKAADGTEPVWFGFTGLIRERENRVSFLRMLSENGVENRPVISGNFARQPGLRRFGIDADPRDYPGAEEIHHRGFFIGLQSEVLPDAILDRVAGILLQE